MAAEVAILAPNPTLDALYSGLVHELSGKSFYRELTLRAGGSGINVARGLCALGVRATTFALLGGPPGELAREALAREGLAVEAIAGAGDTRVAMIEHREAGRRMAVSPSPAAGARSLAALAAACAPALAAAPLIFFGGSFPAAPDVQEALARLLAPHRDKLVIDTRGSVLARLLELAPRCAKVDRADLPAGSAAAGGALEQARDLNRRGVALVCAEADHELYAAYEGRSYAYPQFHAPGGRLYGRGDAFMAGLLAAAARGLGHDARVRWGILAATCPGPPGEGLGSVDAAAFRARLGSLDELAPRRVP